MSQVVSGQRISIAELIFKNFFPAGIRAGGDFRCIKSAACGRASANSPKRAEWQTLDADVGAIAGQDGPNAAMDTETRAAEKDVFLQRK